MLDLPPEGKWRVAIQYLGHSGFRIVSKSGTVYIDPYFSVEGGHYKRLVKPPFSVNDIKIADLVLVTHDHFDHCDIPSIETIKKNTNAVIVGNAAVERKLHTRTTIMRPEQVLELKGIPVRAVPADHPGETPLGYVITLNEVTIYHAGDTDSVPEKLKCDIALLPAGGTFTMDPKQAEEAAKKLGAKLFIPMHYNTFEPIIVQGGLPGHVMKVGEWVTYG